MTTAYLGYGSKLFQSVDGVTFVVTAQLKKFAPAGSKQTIVDQTNLRSPGPFTQPFPAQVDTGEIELEGVYAGDSTQATLAQLHGQMALGYFKGVLSDGTTWAFSAYVSEFKPWEVTYNKAIVFSGKLRVVGGITPPSGPTI
jgi:hypothetical protein